MSLRDDLLHLTPEALSQIANAGIVKRAVRELEGGYRPEWTAAADGALDASFSDGIRIAWPRATPIQHVRCSCGAASICRHRIILALAFREAAALQQPEQPAVASPGAATDEDLAGMIAPALLARARQQREAGVSIDVRRRPTGEPCDTARLPAATVRFWAGAAIASARCDCIAQTACEHVALGVWAFRLADEQAGGAAEPPSAVRVRLGHDGERLALDAAPWMALAEAVIRHGVTAGAAPVAQALSGALAASRALGAIWLEHVVQEFEQWAEAYASRSALYEADNGVALAAELSLRLHAGRLPGNARSVLGIGQGGESELDRLRLVCLGARTSRDGEARRTQLVLADIDTGTALVLVKEWKVPSGKAADAAAEGALRAAERLAPGVRMEPLAQGQLLARQARRLPDGSLVLARARSSQNSVLPQVPDWGPLGAPLRYDSVAALVLRQRDHPTAQVAPRHAARQFVVFTPVRVEGVAYDAHAQTLIAVLRDAQDAAVVLRRAWQSHVRHALDGLASALKGANGPVRHVSGLLHWSGGLPVIEPWAVACDSIVVPDFAQATGSLAQAPLGQAPTEDADPVAVALSALRALLADLLHHGLVQLPAKWKQDSVLAERGLSAQGLHALASKLKSLAAAVLTAQANPAGAQLGPLLCDLAALTQLHQDARVIAGFGEDLVPPDAACP
jgi:hypothetical protein